MVWPIFNCIELNVCLICDKVKNFIVVVYLFMTLEVAIR